MRLLLWAALAVVVSLPAPALAQTNTLASGTTAVITGQGVVSRPPDMATVNINLTTNDDASAAASAKNATMYDALKSALSSLGIDAAQIKTAFYNVSFVPRQVPLVDNRPVPMPMSMPVQGPYQPRFGYVVSRQLQISVTNVVNVGKVIDAAVAAGATNVNNVAFGLSDRKSANEAALALALADATSQANALAGASHMRVVGIKQFQVSPNNGFPVPGPMRFPSGVAQAGVVDLPPATVDVRANVIVTYVLK